MRSKKEIMHKKLALQIMNKSSISNEKWAKLTDTEIMKLTQFPLQVREMLVNIKKTTPLESLTKEVVLQELSKVEDVATITDATVAEYDAEKAIKDVVAEFSSDSVYSSDEIKNAIASLAPYGKNWFILSKKVAAKLTEKTIDQELLEKLSKEAVKAAK